MIARSYARRRRTRGFLSAFAELAWMAHAPGLAHFMRFLRDIDGTRP